MYILRHKKKTYSASLSPSLFMVSEPIASTFPTQKQKQKSSPKASPHLSDDTRTQTESQTQDTHTQKRRRTTKTGERDVTKIDLSPNTQPPLDPCLRHTGFPVRAVVHSHPTFFSLLVVQDFVGFFTFSAKDRDLRTRRTRWRRRRQTTTHSSKEERGKLEEQNCPNRLREENK